MTKYFGYGSNLWFEQMKERCKKSKRIGLGKLKDYRWIISRRGYANIVDSPGDYVLGYVFEINRDDERKLDRNEGATEEQGWSYTKENLEVEVDGEKYECLVYIDRKEVGITEGEPHDEYITRINNGVKDSLNDEDDYVEKYIRKFIPDGT